MNEKSGLSELLTALCKQCLMPDDLKRCNKCGAVKGLSEFHKARTKIKGKGVRGQCKDCLRPYHAKMKKKYADLRRERDKNKPRRTCWRCHAKQPRNQFRGSGRTCLTCYDDIFKARETKIHGALFGELESHEKRHALILALSDGSLDKFTLTGLFAGAKACPYCGVQLKSQTKTLDHMTPISKGGLHGKSNVLICCRECNSRKHNMDFSEWLAVLEGEFRTRMEKLYTKMHNAPAQQKSLTLIYQNGERVA
jgi:hypothetical protein